MARTVVRIMALIAFSVVAPGAASAGWSVGPNFGVSIITPSGGGDALTVLGAPTGRVLFPFSTFAPSPGLRLGFGSAESPHEFFIDTGIMLLAASGVNIVGYDMTGNYQHNFGGSASPGMYLTGGLGIHLLAGEGDALNSLTFGFGGGSRVPLAEGHGTGRFEVRYDRKTETKTQGFTAEPAANMFTLRFGFDLWIKR